MIYPGLRALKPALIGREQVVSHWLRRGVVIHPHPPAPDAVLMSATLADGTVVWLDLRNWLAQAMPETSRLRFDLLDGQEIRNYFCYANPALTLRLPGLNEVLTPLSAVEGHTGTVLAVEISGLWFWLDRVPGRCLEDARAALPARDNRLFPLAFQLRFTLGSSRLSAKHVRRLKRGDVLFINEELHHVMIDDEKLAGYRQTESDLVMIMPPESGPLESADNFNPALTGVRHIPVKLHFVVHETSVSLERLLTLQSGDIFECPQGGAQPVAVYGNGSLLASGELVTIDGGLAVEITAVK